MKPEIISTEEIYKGRIINLTLDTIREDSITYQREVILHHGSTVIVPLFADETVALVRQYRHAAGKYLLELPAGSLEKDEDPEPAAHRELEEEIGVVAENLEKLSEFYVSPGFLSEKMHVFLATNLTEVGQKLEEDELLSVEKLSLAEACDLIKQNKIEDAKTIIGLTLTAARRGIHFL